MPEGKKTYWELVDAEAPSLFFAHDEKYVQAYYFCAGAMHVRRRFLFDAQRLHESTFFSFLFQADW